MAAVLALGIVGFFDYRSPQLGALLIFFAAIAIFCELKTARRCMEQVLISATTGASAIGYAYLAEIPQQQLRARTAGWGLAISNLFAIMFSFCTPLSTSLTHSRASSDMQCSVRLALEAQRAQTGGRKLGFSSLGRGPSSSSSLGSSFQRLRRGRPVR